MTFDGQTYDERSMIIFAIFIVNATGINDVIHRHVLLFFQKIKLPRIF